MNGFDLGMCGGDGVQKSKIYVRVLGVEDRVQGGDWLPTLILYRNFSAVVLALLGCCRAQVQWRVMRGGSGFTR